MIALLLLACVISAGGSASPHNLTFMMIASFGQYGFNSSGALPAADMALEDINSDPDILVGYNLTYDKVRDSMVGQYVFNKQETAIDHSHHSQSIID